MLHGGGVVHFKKAAFAIILLIMTMPTQVSALGFLQLITKMGLKNSFLPLIIPSIAAPAVFFFMKQYLDASLPMEIVEAARIEEPESSTPSIRSCSPS